MMHHGNHMHKGMAADIEALGWFWGTIRTIIKQNPRTIIGAILGGGSVWECMVQGCGHFFSTEGSIQKHFTKTQGSRTVRGWKAPTRKLTQEWEMKGQAANQREDESEREEGDGGEVSSDGEARPTQLDRLPIAPELPQAASQAAQQEEQRGQQADLGLRINPQLIIQQRREDRTNDEWQRTREDMIRRRDYLQSQVESGVTIPQLHTEQMRSVRQGLCDLSAQEINPMSTKFRPESGDWDGWQAFEGACEDSLHRIREHVIRAIRRDPKRLYGEKRLNPKLQAARERTTEMAIETQTIRREFTKSK
jgi:hypothetical protein